MMDDYGSQIKTSVLAGMIGHGSQIQASVLSGIHPLPPPSHPGDTKEVGSSPQAGTHHASDGCHCNDLLRQPVFCRGRPASEQGQWHHPTESFNITASSFVTVTTRMKSRRVTSSCNWLLWHTAPALAWCLLSSQAQHGSQGEAWEGKAKQADHST